MKSNHPSRLTGSPMASPSDDRLTKCMRLKSIDYILNPTRDGGAIIHASFSSLLSPSQQDTRPQIAQVARPGNGY